MSWKESKLYSILKFKCPYCHEGDFFMAHPYNLKRAGDLHERCSVCQGKYNIEPGFYWGAMFVSYALGVAVVVSIWVALLVLAPAVGPDGQVGSCIVVMLLAGPYLYALSKIIWANMFLHYKGPVPEEKA